MNELKNQRNLNFWFDGNEMYVPCASWTNVTGLCCNTVVLPLSVFVLHRTTVLSGRRSAAGRWSLAGQWAAVGGRRRVGRRWSVAGRWAEVGDGLMGGGR